MQPHSMCAVSLANYIWNNYQRQPESEFRMTVDYRNHHGNYRSLKYRLFNVRVSPDNLELKMNIQRDGGGIDCEVTCRRSSVREGAEVTQTHGQQHVAGLREVYNLYRGKVMNGTHYGSRKYKSFRGETPAKSDPKTLHLHTDVKRPDGSFVEVFYESRIM